MDRRNEMRRQFVPWVMATYGDSSSKTKTITRSKHARIVAILRGQDDIPGETGETHLTNSENTKFKFWIRSRNFRIGHPDHMLDWNRDLYVPAIRSKVRNRHLQNSFNILSILI